jgi:hypothetical protein
MVSKLLLAVQETFHRACDAGAPNPVRRRLASAYHDIRAGIGDHKSPQEYGAFPIDPYSHTPAHAGARQPGLTGQVKEDILCRFGELGVRVRNGQLHFDPRLLRNTEFLPDPAGFEYYDLAGVLRRLRLPAHSLAFTCCQVPVLYRLGQQPHLALALADGTAIRQPGLALDAASSRSIFQREGRIARLTVWLGHRR